MPHVPRKTGTWDLTWAGHADGGAALELYEVVPGQDGLLRRVLLGDVTNGGSAVYVPEPATVALLGLGALALIGRQSRRTQPRKK
jgi:hypothetical protein